jgi:tRNA (guanine6-N2)-methyltransferase
MRYEAEVLPGLEPFAAAEIRRRLGETSAVGEGAAGDLPFEYGGDPYDLLALRTVVAVYQVLDFDIPRPKALLGHQNFHRMVDAITKVEALHPPKSFRTFRFSAAGRDSSVFDRLRDDLAAETRLANAPDEADLLLRVRPNADRGKGWQVLIRLTPRPLATRDWRACDMPGALNASIAAAMVEMTNPRPDDAFFNPMCGSGTLLIERVARMPVDLAAGCDTDPDALACGRENVRSAGLGHVIDLLAMDAAALDLPDGAFTALAADLPWGQLSGEHAENPALYRAVLREWARVAVRGARLAVITHEVAVFEDLLGEIADVWALIDVVKVFQGGLHPRIYVFARL